MSRAIFGLTALLVLTAPRLAAAAPHAVPFIEDWSTNDPHERWYARDDKGINVVQNESKTDFWQREIIRFDGGRVFMKSPIAVTGGQTYCLETSIRATAGVAPFVGIWPTDAEAHLGPINDSHFLFGQEGYATGFGPMVVPVQTDEQWHTYAAAFIMPEKFEHIVIFDEIWVNGAEGVGEFDDLKLSAGDCQGKPPASPPLTEKGTKTGAASASRPAGCTVAHGPASAGTFVALAALALVGGWRRRGRR